MHEFFAASAGVSGALVGLLFVAISVSTERLAKAGVPAQLHRIRAYAALLAFNNALAVSLFALIPGEQVGMASLVVAIIGLMFVTAALLSLIRLRAARWTAIRDALFLIGLATAFIYQLTAAIGLIARPGDSGAVETIAYLVTACFLIGIARAWELIGGPTIGLSDEFAALVRGEGAAGRGAGRPAEDAGEPAGDEGGPAGGASGAQRTGTAAHRDQPPA